MIRPERLLIAVVIAMICGCGDGESARNAALESAEQACQHGYGGISYGGQLQEWRGDRLVGETTSMPSDDKQKWCDGPVMYYTQKQCDGTFSDACGVTQQWSQGDLTISIVTTGVPHLATGATLQPVCATYPHEWAQPQVRYAHVRTAYEQAKAAGLTPYRLFPLLKTLILLYESKDTSGKLRTDQHAHARTLYADREIRDYMFAQYPNELPHTMWGSCGSSQVQCELPSVAAGDLGKLTRCERMLRVHVDPALARAEYDDCVSWSTPALAALDAAVCTGAQIDETTTVSVSDPERVLDPVVVGIYDYAPNCVGDEVDPSNPNGAACFRKRGSQGIRLVRGGCSYEIGERVGSGSAGWILYARNQRGDLTGCPPEGAPLSELDHGTFWPPDAADDAPGATTFLNVVWKGPRAINALDETLLALWQKQLALDPSIATANDADAVAELGGQLRRLDQWNSVNTQIARERSGASGGISFAEFAALQADQSGALTRWWGALWAAYDTTSSVIGALAALPCEDGGVGTNPRACQEDLDEQLATLTTALGKSRGNSKKAVQQLIKALFTKIQTPSGAVMPFSTGSAPVQRLFFPLLADCFALLESRLEELVAYHDFACLFKPCATVPTQLSRAYRLLAHLDPLRTDATLTQVLAEPMGDGTTPVPAATLALGGWKPVFQTIAAANHPQITALWADYRKEDGPEDYVDADSVRFRNLVVDAQDRDARYRKSGQLSPGTNVLSAGVSTDKVGDLRELLVERTGKLRALKLQLEQQRRELTRDAIGYVKETGGHESVRKTAERLRAEYDDTRDKIKALERNIRDADIGFAELLAQYKDLASAVDGNEVFEVGESAIFQVTSANGSNAEPFNESCTTGSCFIRSRFEDPNLIKVKAPGTQVLLAKGELLQVKASGVYSPTCALHGSTMMFQGSSQLQLNLTFNANDSVVGPEGFYFARTQDSYRTRALTEGGSDSSGEDFVSFITGGIFSAGTHEVQSDHHTLGTENKWSATFSEGIRIGTTPYNQFPAGALLMVSEHVGGGPVDVQVVRDGVTTLIPTTNSRVTFVVNDTRCPAGDSPDADDAVTVAWTKLASQGLYLDKILDAMSDMLYGTTSTTVDGTRDPVFEVETYAEQGVLLAANISDIQSHALTKLEGALAPALDLDEVPPQLLRLFNALVNREITRIARAVEVRNLKRRRRELVIELQGVGAVIAQGEKTNYLHEVHLARTLSQIDERHLRAEAATLLRTTRERLYPALKIWYPDVLAGLANDPLFATDIHELALNASLDPAESVSAWIGDATTTTSTIENVLNRVLGAIELAEIGDVGAGANPQYITLAIPKPTGTACPPGAPYCMPFPHNYTPGSRTVDPIRARAFWEAFYSTNPAIQQRVPITITPEDVYSVGETTQGLLGCRDASAVVRRVGFTFGRVDGYGNADGPDGLNQMIRYLGGFIPREQLFVTAAGWEKFTLASNTQFEAFSGRAAYGFVFAPLVSINAHSNSARPTGLSPFGDFELDVWAAFHGGWFFLGNEHDTAQDITLVLEVDARRSGDIVPGIARCKDAFDPQKAP